MEGSAGGGAGQKGPSRRSFGPQRQQQGGAMMRAPPGAAAAAAHAHAQAHAQAQGMMGPVMGPHGNATHPQQVPVVVEGSCATMMLANAKYLQILILCHVVLLCRGCAADSLLQAAVRQSVASLRYRLAFKHRERLTPPPPPRPPLRPPGPRRHEICTWY